MLNHEPACYAEGMKPRRGKQQKKNYALSACCVPFTPSPLPPAYLGGLLKRTSPPAFLVGTSAALDMILMVRLEFKNFVT